MVEAQLGKIFLGLILFTSLFVGGSLVYTGFASAYSVSASTDNLDRNAEFQSYIEDMQSNLQKDKISFGAVTDVFTGPWNTIKLFSKSTKFFLNSVLTSNFGGGVKIPTWAMSLITTFMSALILLSVVFLLWKNKG